MAKGYYDKWKKKDAALRAQGFPSSKLGPGAPAVTTTSAFGGTKFQDDNGDYISGDEIVRKREKWSLSSAA